MVIQGLEILLSLLTSELEDSRILAGDFLASLSHTRAGIPSAIVSAGGVKLLLDNLASNVEAVIASAAVALGYLSFNGTAAREMMTAMRNEPELFSIFRHYTFNGKVSPQFLESWMTTRKVGLPALCLEAKGGPPVIADRLPLDGRISVPVAGWQPGDAELVNPFRRAASTPAMKHKSKRRSVSAPGCVQRMRSVISTSMSFSSTTSGKQPHPGTKTLTGPQLSKHAYAVSFDHPFS